FGGLGRKPAAVACAAPAAPLRMKYRFHGSRRPRRRILEPLLRLTVTVRARQHVRRMRGGANSHLLLADDDCYYVVKFRNNPQHARVLVNELICYVLLDRLGLPTPGWSIVEVSPSLIERCPDLAMECASRIVRCEPGL